ncbi:hypothetical protein [Enterococcus faecium]|uniref:hypothetical protein n=1 Tax=Enterococcus faecium TaxID=1352 RepID=UPI000BEF6E92|nr:hypothetical protein [Enterococcus faecium]PEH49520.1 hypothetical protein CRM75_01835 [Enterococcus faecium]
MYGDFRTQEYSKISSLYEVEHASPTVLGVEDKTIYVGNVFDPSERVTAQDWEGINLTPSIVVDGTVDSPKVRTY